jgi:hypothetical protein
MRHARHAWKPKHPQPKREVREWCPGGSHRRQMAGTHKAPSFRAGRTHAPSFPCSCPTSVKSPPYRTRRCTRQTATFSTAQSRPPRPEGKTAQRVPRMTASKAHSLHEAYKHAQTRAGRGVVEALTKRGAATQRCQRCVALRRSHPRACCVTSSRRSTLARAWDNRTKLSSCRVVMGVESASPNFAGTPTDHNAHVNALWKSPDTRQHRGTERGGVGTPRAVVLETLCVGAGPSAAKNTYCSSHAG